MKLVQLLIKLAIIISILCASGCKAVVKKGYSGPELPDEKIAKIYIPATVYLQMLDGQPYFRPELNPKTFYYIKIFPGSHSITMLPIYAPQGHGNVSGIGTKLVFNAKAKDMYEPKFLVYNVRQEYNKVNYQSKAWVQNSTKYKNALYYFKKGQYKKAISYCNKALEDSFCPDTHALRGSCYTQMGEYDKAITEFSEGIIFNPEPSPL